MALIVCYTREENADMVIGITVIRGDVELMDQRRGGRLQYASSRINCASSERPIL